jgi:hypothetical protein
MSSKNVAVHINFLKNKKFLENQLKLSYIIVIFYYGCFLFAKQNKSIVHCIIKNN